MERSFAKEIELLRLKEGEVFTGEGILAVTKALLQSGVSYVGGYQGAPVSHLLDVLVQAEELMSELGINVEANSSEASAAAMLAASTPSFITPGDTVGLTAFLIFARSSLFISSIFS